jgi:N-acetylmuramoyl-L-alanine amidase
MLITNLILHTVAKKGLTEWDEIKRWHVEQNGWSDVGYHYYVKKSGVILTGRAEHVKGAHCKAGGMNSKSLGICFEGHGDYEPWTKEQEEKGLELIVNLCKKYNIKAKDVEGHNEYEPNKTCPGKLIDMDIVRRKVKTLNPNPSLSGTF